jgi:hypothetical protein
MGPTPSELTGSNTRSRATVSARIAAQRPFDCVTPKLTKRLASISSQLLPLPVLLQTP